MIHSLRNKAHKMTPSPEIAPHQGIGFMFDAILGSTALGAWLLDIEHVIGTTSAMIVFACAAVTAVARMIYWIRKARNEGRNE